MHFRTSSGFNCEFDPRRVFGFVRRGYDTLLVCGTMGAVFEFF